MHIKWPNITEILYPDQDPSGAASFWSKKFIINDTVGTTYHVHTTTKEFF